MAVITKISIQQKNKERFNIYIDDGTGERYAFSVHQDVLVSEQLQKGIEIDEFDIEQISFHEDVNKAYQSSLSFLSYRMRSTVEVIQHLKEKEYEEPVIQEVIQKLIQLKYLDDKEFGLAYMKTNAKVSLKGPVILRQELMLKGINGSTLEEVIHEYTIDDQLFYASKVAEKGLRKASNSSGKMQKQKTIELLQRKGFTKDIISQVLEEMAPEKDETEEWAVLCQAGAKAHRKYQKYEGYQYTQKMKQFLYQKGFAFEMIEQYLQSDELLEEQS